jgi:galactokinase
VNSYLSRPGAGSTPHFVKPFLNALSQIHEGDAANRADYIAHAERAHAQLSDAQPVVSAFARGSIGLQADHTHYFDGFALMLPMRRGVGISVSRSSREFSRLKVDGVEDVEQFTRAGESEGPFSDTVRLLILLLKELEFPATENIDIAVASGLPSGLFPVFAASFSVSVHRAFEKLTDRIVSDRERIANCHRAIEAFFGHRFSLAYIRGSNILETHSFVLVDTQSLSFVPMDVSDSERLGWGLLDTFEAPLVSFPSGKLEAVQSITNKLKERKFNNIESIRDIEHRDIEAAAKILSRKHRSTFRFLVTENRRVQQLVTAIKRNDWQMVGTILLISHEARKTEWKATTPHQDSIIDLTERFSDEGVYGATQTGESSCVLVAGQVFAIPGFMDAVHSQSVEGGITPPETILL